MLLFIIGFRGLFGFRGLRRLIGCNILACSPADARPSVLGLHCSRAASPSKVGTFGFEGRVLVLFRFEG